MSEQDNFKEELAQIDERIEFLKSSIKYGEDLESLHNDERFINVFIDGYFGREENRLTGILFNPTQLKRDQIENVMDKATAIRNLKHYIRTILIDASMAPEQINDEEALRKEVTARAALTEEE